MRGLWMAAGAVVLAGMVAGCTVDPKVEAASRAADDRELTKALEGRVAGTPQDCISPTGLSGPRIIGDRTLLYSSGRTLYRVDVEGGCPGLAPYNTLLVEMQGSQLCRNDRFRMIQPGVAIPGPYCRMGKFVPYVKAR
ncbi:hypothetical protein ACG3SL_02050 [Sphingomonas sp. CJ20]